MQNAAHAIRQELLGIVVFIGVIWAVFVVSLILPSLDEFGVVPRTASGLIGIAAMPFLHADLHHILSNTLPLFILLALLAGSKARSWEIVALIVFLGGLLLWLFGRTADHIGASGLIFGLSVFLMVSGALERRIVPLIVAVIVVFMYGGAMLYGVVPQLGSNVSWDCHLCGGVAGALVAYVLTRKPASRAVIETG